MSCARSAGVRAASRKIMRHFNILLCDRTLETRRSFFDFAFGFFSIVESARRKMAESPQSLTIY
jgi:hypothetical protein